MHLIGHYHARALGQKSELLGVGIRLAIVARVCQNQERLIGCVDFVWG